MSKTYSKTRILVECALMIAIGTVLSNIKFFTMPNGGSITLLSMLPFVLVSFRHGAKWGLFTGFVNACLQMIMGFYPPPASTFLYFLGEVLLDYVLAFMALGLAELFARPFKNRTVGVAVGTFAAGFLRFMCSFLSGVLVWGCLLYTSAVTSRRASPAAAAISSMVGSRPSCFSSVSRACMAR